MMLFVRHSSRTYLYAFGITLFYVVTTIFMTWPLVAQMDRSVVGWVGDNYYFVWLVGWVQKALFELHASPLTVPTLNYPAGWNLAYNEMTLAMVLLALPASLLGGPTLGYNFALLASFVLSGIGAYWWTQQITRNRAAALIAGVIFAFVPYRMSHLLGHLNLMGTQWLPLYFMGLTSLLAARVHPKNPQSLPPAAAGPSKNLLTNAEVPRQQPPLTRVRATKAGSIWFTALSLGLIAFTSQYYLYSTLLLSVVYVALYLLVVDSSAVDGLARLARVMVLASPLVLLAIWPYVQLARQNVLPQRTLDEVRVWSASPTDFFLPSPQHFLWGEWVARHIDRSLWIESSLYLGTVTMLLALIAIIRARQLECSHRFVILLGMTALVALTLALGTDLHWWGQSVIVDVPAFLQRWHPYQQTFIPLPGYLLFKTMPFYATMRVWMRYGIFVSLFMSVLAGIGSDWLLRRVGRIWSYGLATLIVILVLIDFYPGVQELSPVAGRPVDVWLAAQPQMGALIQFPLAQVTSPEQTYYTLIHEKPFVGGFFAAFAPPQFQRMTPVLKNFPSSESIALLRELGVYWVVVDAGHYADFDHMQSQLATLNASLMMSSGNEHVFALNPIPDE